MSFDPREFQIENVLQQLVEAYGGVGPALEELRDSADSGAYLPESRERITLGELADILKSWLPSRSSSPARLLPRVKVYFGTDRVTADAALRDGLIPQLKPWTGAALDYAMGEYAEFRPGAGVERGTYVTSSPSIASGFGRVVLELDVPRSWLKVPAEMTELGYTKADLDFVLGTENGAVIKRAVAPDNIKELVMNPREKPQILDAYSLCTADCEGGNHVGEWITCDRCGSSVHVKVFEVSHPEHGYIKVGSECFKDVMGYKFGKAHEQAIEAREALLRWAADFAEGAKRFRRPITAELVALGLPKALSGYHHVPVNVVFADASGKVQTDNTYNFENASRFARIRPHPPAPHGWSKRIITAGLDMGLWKPLVETPYEKTRWFDSPYVLELMEPK